MMMKTVFLFKGLGVVNETLVRWIRLGITFQVVPVLNTVLCPWFRQYQDMRS